MNNRRKLEIVGIIAILLFCLWIMVDCNLNTNMWFDEYVFTRLSSNLPNYSTSGDWVNQIPSTVWYADVGQNIYNIVYNAPVYLHMPLAPAIVYPLVKLTDDIHLLRIFTIMLTLVSVYLVYAILRRRIGTYALLCVAPILFSNILLSGAMWFYWDAFMAFFFLLTFYLMERNPKSKWQYVLACCLVWTKMNIGIALLIPLAFKNWKILLCALSIIPFYIYTVIITGDYAYIITHYWHQTSFYKMLYSTYILPYIWQVLNAWGMLPYLIFTAGILLFVKKYPTIVFFYLGSILYGFGAGVGTYQAALMLYSGALACPLVIYHFVEKQRGHIETIIG